MKKQAVVVKDFTGAYLVRFVVTANENTVFVTTEKEYEGIVIGASDRFAIGFPREDVFKYEGPQHGPINPKLLQPW